MRHAHNEPSSLVSTEQAQYPHVAIDASLDASHGRDVGGSPFRPANGVQLRRRNKALNVEHFAGSGTGHVPKRHSDYACRSVPKRHNDSVCRSIPKRHTDGESSELFSGLNLNARAS